jgi:amino acid adenylation domain-containing protein
VESVTHRPQSAIADLDILSEDDRRQVLCEFNPATTENPTNKCIHQLFEEQALRLPDHDALVFENERLTYGELNARANQLAHHLRALGVIPETPVALCMNRSLDMVVGVLGILKAGGAWLPVDPGYPKERLEFMFNNARAPMLLTESALVDKLLRPGSETVLLDADWPLISCQSHENPTCVTNPTNLAYVIYTSGSTGQPKGVMVPHSSLCQYVQALDKPLGIAAEDVYLHTASIAFSSSVRQLMLPLTHGSKVVIASIDRISQPQDLFRMIKGEGATIIDIVPTYWRNCINALSNLESAAREKLLENRLRLIVTVSEPLLSDLPRRWAFEFKHPAKLLNMFGQTETTGIVAVYPIPPVDHRDVKIVHIGHPISNAKIYVLNARQQPVPIGVLGEIYVAGGGLSRGYLNQPGLTAERFVPNPFTDEPGARLYRTGDLGRHLPDGNIEFVGRTDQQVKIRGLRVELSEIESVLNRYADVRQAVVIAREDVPGEKRLIAYVVADGSGDAATTDLRRFISEKLPDYMVPAVFIFLEALPMTPSGKVDRLGLPAPNQSMRNLGAVFVAPRTVVEDALAQIWSEMLGLEQVGVHDDFFDLGGHSLLATQITSKVLKTLQVELPVRSFFEVPTIAGLACLIETIGWTRQGQSIESKGEREQGSL